MEASECSPDRPIRIDVAGQYAAIWQHDVLQDKKIVCM